MTNLFRRLFRKPTASEDLATAEAMTRRGDDAATGGDAAVAIVCYARAIAAAPRLADAYLRLGGIFYAQQRFAEGVSLLERAVAAGLALPVIHHNLGICLRETGRLAEAESNFRRTLALQSDNAAAHYEIGLLCLRGARLEAATTEFRCAVELRPDYAEALIGLGHSLMRLDRKTEAEQAYRQATTIHPRMAEAHNALGLLQMEQRHLAEAESSFRQAIAARPDLVGFRRNLGMAFQRAGNYAAAEQLFRDIIAVNPADAGVHADIGRLFWEQHRLEQAEAACRRALELDPENLEVRRDLGYILLASGRLGEGWPLHEIRYDKRLTDKRFIVATPKFPFPQWQGQPLVGKSLLIWYEQGFGDEIQFARYAELLKARGAARVGLVCTRPLLELFESLSGVDQLHVAEPATCYPSYDYWTMLMSLPLQSGTTLESIPARLPYLAAPVAREAHWRDRLPSQGLRVGLVWKGNPKHNNDYHRSLPGLATLAPLWSVGGVSFVSLQKGAGQEEAKAPPAGQPLLELGSEMGDFADAAAIVAQLDLVICVDTAIAHLAGALNKPCWVMLPWVGTDWRWLQGREDSPWYPKVMRLFRQPAPSDWTPVVEEMTRALRAFVGEPLEGDPAECKRRGNLCLLRGDVTMAESCYREALALDPDYAEALTNLGHVLTVQRRAQEAEIALQRAVEVRPNLPEAWNNLASLMRDQGFLDKAEQAYRNSLAARPEYVGALGNLGTLLLDAGRGTEAEALYRDFLADHPNAVAVRYFLSLCLLAAGNLEEGWRHHEARYDARLAEPVATLPALPFPRWDGEALTGKSVLVWCEQGLGDAIQFCRYLPLLKDRGAARVGLACLPPLLPLFERLSDVDHLYAVDGEVRLHAYDHVVLLMSLPLQCGTTLENVPARLPYLAASAAREAQWRDRLPSQGLRVGLVWKGNPKHNNDYHRSLPGLATLTPLWSVEGVSFISLQKGAGEEEAKAPPTGQPLTELGSEMGDFADAAAIVAQLDLVICVDTAIAHLAGALNKPCWVMLPWVGTDWRWMQDREDSPWYPGALRLFRQPAPSDWTPVVEKLTCALRAFAAQARAQ